MGKLNRGNIIFLESVDSTNRYAVDNFANFADFSLIVADEQSSGRGRRGKKWYSPKGKNFYGSFIIKNWPYKAYQASWLAGLGAMESIKLSTPGSNLWIKWPNDIFCGEKKIAGILNEVKSSSKNRFEGIVLGLGINVNMTVEDTVTVDQPCTSIAIEGGKNLNIKNFSEKVCRILKRLYSTSLKNGIEKIYNEWKKSNRLIGKKISLISENGRKVSGTVEDLSFDGRILLGTEGNTESFHSGDIEIDKSFFKIGENNAYS